MVESNLLHESILVKLNQAAQDPKRTENAILNFRELKHEEMTTRLNALVAMLTQVNVKTEDEEESRRLNGLTADWTSHLFVTQKHPLVQESVADVSKSKTREELRLEFGYLLWLFSISDMRRRKECGEDCTHWWHKLEDGDRT